MEPNASNPQPPEQPSSPESEEDKNLQIESERRQLDERKKTTPEADNSSTQTTPAGPLPAASPNHKLRQSPLATPPAATDGLKDFIDQAEAVIKTQADDPHQEEESAEQLNKDYLKKHFDFDVNKPK